MDRALNAAMRYRNVAPSAPHASHMPSYTFTRLGLWQDSIASYQSVLAITKDPVSRLHSQDNTAYAYLQLGQDRAAEAVLAEIRAMNSNHEGEGLVAATYSLAAVPARLKLSPDVMSFPWDVYPQAAAASGDRKKARDYLSKLNEQWQGADQNHAELARVRQAVTAN